MTIINMVGGGGTSGPQVPLDAISVIAVVGGDTEATITWTDPSDIVVNGVTVTTWSSTKLVRKVGSAPTDSTDGTLVVTETVRDTYSVSGYNDTGLTNGTTYYYAAFAVGNNGLETISSTTPSVTPAQGGWQPGANTVAYYPLSSDLIDTVHSQTLTANGTYTFNKIGGATINSISIDNKLTGTNSYLPLFDNDRTISLWCYTTSRGAESSAYFSYGNTSNNAMCQISSGPSGCGITQYGAASNWMGTIALNVWSHICVVYQKATHLFTIYINGSSVGTWSWTIATSGSNVWINTIPRASGTTPNKGNWSNIIIEDKARTSQEISDYFDQTKADYGIS